MTPIQLEFVGKLELMLAYIIHDQKYKLAQAWAPVVEWCQKGEPVIAVLEGEASGVDEEVLNVLRNVFDLKKWS